MGDQSATPERIVRPSVEALDAILGEAIRVLDDGFVRVVDYMGDDARHRAGGARLLRQGHEARPARTARSSAT